MGVDRVLQGRGLVLSGKTLKKPLVFDVPVDSPIQITLSPAT